MRHSEPSIHGFTLRMADELGHDEAPDCCDDEMTRSIDGHGDLVYTCGGCGTVLEVDELGLVFDIREKTTAGTPKTED